MIELVDRCKQTDQLYDANFPFHLMFTLYSQHCLSQKPWKKSNSVKHAAPAMEILGWVITKGRIDLKGTHLALPQISFKCTKANKSVIIQKKFYNK